MARTIKKPPKVILGGCSFAALKEDKSKGLSSESDSERIFQKKKGASQGMAWGRSPFYIWY